MFTVEMNSKVIKYDAPIRLDALLRDRFSKYAVGAWVDGRLCELTKFADHNCKVDAVTLECEDGVRIYLRTLKFVFIMAVNKLYPGCAVKFLYGLSRGQYCEINGIGLDSEAVRRIEDEMRSLIKQDIPFERIKVSKEKAEQIYNDAGYLDKTELLKYRPEDEVNLYRCANVVNYLYGHMMPSTGYLRTFKLHFHSPGIVIMYPRHELGGAVPDFEQSVKFDKTLWNAQNWGKTTGVSNISQLNKLIDNGRIADLINMSEIRHENEIEHMACEIADGIRHNRVILIAGPSSSGKTTLSRKLKAHLAVKGIRAMPLSTDDYYKNRSEIPVDEDGNIDLEHIDTIDVQRFNKDLLSLIKGDEVQLPSYDFTSGKRSVGDPISIGRDECIIVEGIHGLNEALTGLIPRYNKYKIYISALSHIGIDDHTPVSTTTARLIRRIVRDNSFRGASIEETLDMWQSVRRGEFRWIYPFQEEADYIFNSEVTYELAVLKKYIMPLIDSVKADNKYFAKINSISKVMKYVRSIEDDLVPSNSILREFIGGSTYK
ncbi:MAG: nucleoside kinase [Clostridiales bacterium]|nr:nucleoside kinase [Clostridiales bacterium]